MRLIVGIVSINLIIIAFAVLSIRKSKIQYEERAAITTQNIARISAEYINSVIDRTNLALVVVADDMKRQAANGRIHTHILKSLVDQENTGLLGLDNLRISDKHGETRFAVGKTANMQENIADKEYFVKLRDNPHEKLVISDSEQDRSSGNWNIRLARRINLPDGSFAGVVYCVMNLEHLSKVFADLKLGKDGSIALRNKNMGIIVRYPSSDGVLNNPMGQKNVSRKLQELVESGHNDETYKAIYPLDGIERTYTFRRVSNYPLYVTVGLANKTYLAAWRIDTTRISVTVFFFFLISLIVSYYIYNSWRRQQLILKTYRESEEDFRAIFENALFGSILLTPEGQIVKSNQMIENLLGYMPSEMKLLNIMDISFPEDCNIDHDLYQSMLEGWRQSYQIEKRFVSNSGSIIWGMMSASVVRDDSGSIRYVVNMIEDISASKAADEQLYYQSTHDSMTNLRNRAYFDEKFSYMQLGLHLPVSIIIIDLDGLKQVNDSQGHEAGDCLIIAAATVIREAFINNDIVARIGGDEFSILLPETDEKIAESFVEHLRQCQAEFNDKSNDIRVLFSVGMATAYHGDLLSDAWKQADDRMYAEKALHKSRREKSSITAP